MSRKKPAGSRRAPRFVNVHEAKTHLSRLLKQVDLGEEIVIGRDGKPVARLIPYREPPVKRLLGQASGRIRVALDFDTLPERVIRQFEDGPLFPE